MVFRHIVTVTQKAMDECFIEVKNLILIGEK